MPRIHPSLTIPTCGPSIAPPLALLPRHLEIYYAHEPNTLIPMPSIPLIMPQLGESIAEATVINLLVKPGDQVQADQEIIEVETNKATMNVTAPCPGKVEKLLAQPNESYAVGAILGYLEANSEDAARLGLDGSSPEEEPAEAALGSPAPARTDGMRKSVQPTVRGLPVPANAAGAG